jgi:hypothetical protein
MSERSPDRRSDLAYSLGRRLDNRPETLLALAQYILGPLALGYIDQHIDGAAQAVVCYIRFPGLCLDENSPNTDLKKNSSLRLRGVGFAGYLYALALFCAKGGRYWHSRNC